MLPRFSANYSFDLTDADSEDCCYSWSGSRSGISHTTNSLDLLRRQDGHTMFLPGGMVLLSTTTLSYLVVRVTLVSAREQMGRVATRRVVAGMKNKQSLGNRAISDGVCNDVGIDNLVSDAELSVSAWPSVRPPGPTLISATNIDFSPKASKVFCGKIEYGHLDSPVQNRGVLAPSVCRARSRQYYNIPLMVCQ